MRCDSNVVCWSLTFVCLHWTLLFLIRSRAGSVGETSDGGFQASNEPGGRFWTFRIGLIIFFLWALCDLSITCISWRNSLGTMVYCLWMEALIWSHGFQDCALTYFILSASIYICGMVLSGYVSYAMHFLIRLDVQADCIKNVVCASMCAKGLGWHPCMSMIWILHNQSCLKRTWRIQQSQDSRICCSSRHASTWQVAEWNITLRAVKKVVASIWFVNANVSEHSIHRILFACKSWLIFCRA